jgi:hypothetical protein
MDYIRLFLTNERSTLFELQVTEHDRNASITETAEGKPDEFLTQNPTIAL